MQPLTPIQVRVLGSLIEKRRTTPDQYPLTLNALKTACNQKTARDPVTRYSEGEVGHTVRELEALNLVREVWSARVHRYEHIADKTWDIQMKGMALLGTLMLRGPQTLGELKSHSHRLFEFDDLDDVQYALKRLAEREPPMATALPRQPGQKEGRYAHLLCGEPEITPVPDAVAESEPKSPGTNQTALTTRLDALEARLAQLEERLGSQESEG